MSDKKVRVPQIRFAGFMGEWEERKLGSLVTAITRTDSESTAPVMMISAASGFINQSEKYSSNNAGQSLAKYILLRKGELAYNHGASKQRQYGSCFDLKVDEARIPFVYHCFEVGQNNPDFIARELNEPRMDKQLRRLVSSGARMDGLLNISFEAYKTVIITVPQIKEQDKISGLLLELDNLISLQQRQVDKLASVKKTMLAKMFPKDGANEPEIRFAGFTGAWEERKLGELTEVYDGTHQTPQYTDCGIMFLSVENIKSLRSDKYISEEAFKGEFKVFPEKGDVLMTRIGDIGTANVIETNEPIAYYVSLALLKRKELDPYFLKESIFTKTVKKELWHRTLHIAFPKKINKNEIEKVLVSYPKSKLEQEQIGSFFRSLDNLITLHQRELNALKTLKKSMLQQLFV